MGKEYSLIVETNRYVGSFEREMCAFMTGHIGDCGVGRKEQVIYDELGKPRIKGVISKYSELNTPNIKRPVTIIATRNSPRKTAFQIHFSEEPTLEDIQFMKGRAMVYSRIYGAFRNQKLEILDLHIKVNEKP